MRSELKTHPYMKTEPCTGCTPPDADCARCGGRGYGFKFKPSDVPNNTTIRIGDLLVHKSEEGSLQGRFDSWEPSQWIWIPSQEGLASMLDSTRERRR